jgi:hypothetical protein
MTNTFESNIDRASPSPVAKVPRSISDPVLAALRARARARAFPDAFGARMQFRSLFLLLALVLGAISLAIPLKQMEKPADHDRVDPQPSRKSPRSAVHCRSRARKTTVTFSVER